MILAPIRALLLASFVSYGIADDVSFGVRRQPAVALLLALPDGNAGVVALMKWASRVEEDAGVKLPPVWVLFSSGEETANALVQDLPHFRPFMVENHSTWAQVLKSFRDQNQDATVFGFIGEGVLPPSDFSGSIQHVIEALAGSGSTPTAVLTRSKSRGDDAGQHEWLPDTFIAQLWMNRESLTDSVLENDFVRDDTLLEMLPRFLRAHRDSTGTNLVLVDGTNVLTSIIDVTARGHLEVSAVENRAAPEGGNLYFGTLPLAIVLDPNDSDGGSGQEQASIATAPWPPGYILETAANDELVIVNSVNCGYLDFASNFLHSVQNVSDMKVLWVTMDDVAFDFIDDLSPGRAAAFPVEGSERHHAIKAGNFGDPTFSSQTNIRPNLLLHILDQGYAVLWTDSDMVWLRDPTPLLPNMNDPEAAELMVQYDGANDHPCTCFLFMKPTSAVKELIIRWAKNIVDTHATQDQIAFQAPYQAAKAGISIEVFPDINFPSGKFLLGRAHEDNFARIHGGDMMIFHNNFIVGHGKKLKRFKDYGIWGVEGRVFPSC